MGVSVITLAPKHHITGSKQGKRRTFIIAPTQLGENSVKTLAQTLFEDELTGSDV